jgi:hypothetical protein
MFRIVIGSVVAGLVQFIIGAIAWVSPLGALAFKTLGDTETAQVQSALASGLTATGSGTYFIPSPETAAGTTLLGRGPVALIHFNTNGFPPMNTGALVTGLVMSIVVMLLVGVAVQRLPDFRSRMQTTVLFAIATVVYFVLSLPVYNFYLPWAWWVFLGIQEFIAFTLGAFVLLRWFMPTPSQQAQQPVG